MRFLSHLLGLSLFMSASQVYALSTEEFTRQVDQYNFFTNSPATFATICRADDCFSTALGSKSIQRREPVSSESLFSIGSNSKFITAILTLRLVDKGVLRLEDQLTDYFPEYSLWKGVTVRDLLQHSSGVPPYVFSEDGLRRVTLSVFNWRTRKWKPQDLVGIVQKMPLIFPPGSRVEYNNTNYVLAGMILQKAANKPLGVLLRDELFGPLGMNDTFLSLSETDRNRRVSGYVSMHAPVPNWLFNLVAWKVDAVGDYLDTTRIFDDSFTWAAGGMLSTTADLAKLLRALFAGNLLSPQMFAEMKTFRSGIVLGMPFVYGLGLMKMPSDQGELLGHGGLTPGYQTLTNYLPSQDLTLVLSQTIGPGQLYSFYFDLLDIVTRDNAYRDFVPMPEVAESRLPDQALHLRFYGKITDGRPTGSPFPKGVGYSKLKSRSFPAVYQSYSSRIVEREGRKYIVLEGTTGGNIFGGRNGQDSKREFVRLFIDRSDLVVGGPGLTSDVERPNAVFVYRGSETKDANGVAKECVAEVMDRSRAHFVQIDGLEGESFELNQTVKVVGNIPLKKLSLIDIPDELRHESIEVCR